jgi:hypothetical protein
MYNRFYPGATGEQGPWPVEDDVFIPMALAVAMSPFRPAELWDLAGLSTTRRRIRLIRTRRSGDETLFHAGDVADLASIATPIGLVPLDEGDIP